MDIYFATDRQRVEKGRAIVYNAGRDEFLHLGKAGVEFIPRGMGWEEIVEQSFSFERKKALRMSVADIREFGALWTTCPLMDDLKEEAETLEQSMSFARDINEKLRRSRRKDIYIYVSGFKVCFDDPVLLSRSLWHYLGYDGAFIAYCWPATQGRLSAYAHDLETTNYCSRNFRLLLDFLAKETEAEQIHLIGHSAGVRIVCNALKELRLIYSRDTEEEIQSALKIGQVILLGADFDRTALRSYYRDNVLALMKKATIYISRKDRALQFSRLLFGTPRLGELEVRNIHPKKIDIIKKERKLELVDVTNARNASTGSGHLYQLTSPWISTDILLCLKHALSPQERGLTSKDGIVWEFDHQYESFLKESLRIPAEAF
ncbi:MAG: alpha/beta hydrolase [Candidatus Omnitrophota bacterium]|nr:alpha/beta hydrolase [Candidatus Omnitrophota bacterium]MDZ4243012.1 alpha/beta hydrolase [Candidatus Omnitrophota bacterium]